MGWVKDKMIQDLELRGYRNRTKAQYLRYAELFVAHYMRCPSKMGAVEIRKYCTELRVKDKVGLATLRSHVSAIKFLYVHTLGRPEEVADLPWPKSRRPMPDILTGKEIKRLIDSVRKPIHRLVIIVAYGAGLRVSEACSLRVSDIDSGRMLIHVRDGKRGKDRFTILSRRLLKELRGYTEKTKPPGPWLFPGKNGGHLGVRSVQTTVRKAAEAAGIKKRVTMHVLRHCFATHLLETGTDIRTIQNLLGHRSIATTQWYTHLCARHIQRMKSPLDIIGTKDGKVLEEIVE